jgi:hypothetical protein
MFTAEAQRTLRKPKFNKIDGAQDLETAIRLNPLNPVSQSFPLCSALVRTMSRYCGKFIPVLKDGVERIALGLKE